MPRHRFRTLLTEWIYQIRRYKTKKKQPLISHNKDIYLIRKVHGNKRPNYTQLRYISRILSGKERMLFRTAILCFFISIIWIVVGFVIHNRVQVPAVGGRYTEAVVGTPQLINPLFASTNDVDLDISRLVYSGLMKYDEKQRLIPDLASSYTISEDKKVYTFTLRQDVLWHDGEPFTSRDVLYTFESIQNEQVGSPLRVTFQGVNVDMVDDYTITFTLPEPFAPFLSALTVGIIPEHIWFHIPLERIKLAKENIQPIGTGPFLFKKLSKDDTGYIFQYELERNKSYYNTPPYIVEFVFKFFGTYENDGGAIDALRTQKADGIHFVPSDLKEKVARKHINVYTLQLPQYTALFFNQKREPALADLDVRKALAFTIDKERILREVLKDEGQVIYSPILPGFPGYNPEIEKTPYDTVQANELLEKTWKKISAEEYKQKRKQELLAEWEKQQQEKTDTVSTTPEDNLEQRKAEEEQAIDAQLSSELGSAQTFFRQDKNGNILTVSLVTADTPEYRKTANVIAGYWQDAGVKVDVSFVSPRDISRQVLKTREYDVLLYGAIIGSDPDQYPFWHSSQINFPWLNLSQYVNRNVDALLEKARESTDEGEVAELSAKFQEALLADLPAIFLHTPTYNYAIGDKVQGVSLSRIFSPSDRFAGVTNWYIKTKGKWNTEEKELE